jgi:hypothetical protein
MQVDGDRLELPVLSLSQWDNCINSIPAALPFGVRFVAQRWLFCKRGI